MSDTLWDNIQTFINQCTFEKPVTSSWTAPNADLLGLESVYVYVPTERREKFLNACLEFFLNEMRHFQNLKSTPTWEVSFDPTQADKLSADVDAIKTEINKLSL